MMRRDSGHLVPDHYIGSGSLRLRLPLDLPQDHFDHCHVVRGYFDLDQLTFLEDNFLEEQKFTHSTRSLYGENEASVWISYLNYGHWLHGEFSVLANQVNKNMLWDFVLSGWLEPIRVLRYEEGDHDSWHQDYGVHDMTKLSLVAILSSNFTGGQLEFLNYETPTLNAGDVIVFPSFVPHRVTPVTSGQRLVAAGFISGPRFR